MRKIVRLTEGDLHRIVKESIGRVINEAYSDAQYAHLAGQANGALNSLGGRLRGMFSPKWKKRKERQMKKFADQATHQNYGYEKSSTNGGEYNGGGAHYRMPGYDYTLSNGGQADFIDNSFNPENQKSPFEMKRTQRYVTVDNPGDLFSNRTSRPMGNDGRVYSSDETNDMAHQHADRGEWDKFDAMRKLADSNSMLNRAFRQGQKARKGRTHKTFGGETYTDGTGTNSDAFKRLK